MTKEQSIKELMTIPSIGKSIANNLWNIGITCRDDLKGKDPDVLFDQSNRYARMVQDRCRLYSFRCTDGKSELIRRITEIAKKSRQI